MRKTAILIVVGLCSLFYNAEVIFAENSAVFRIVTIMPPSAQAAKEIIFVVGITNTGTETWVSGKSWVIRDLRDCRVRDIEF